MSFWLITIPVTLLLALTLLCLVIRSVLRGDLDDPEGPAIRAALDDDRLPERAGQILTAGPSVESHRHTVMPDRVR